MGHYENLFKKHIALPWGWDVPRSAGSHGDYDLTLIRPEPLRNHDLPIDIPVNLSNLMVPRVHFSEVKTRKGPKLSLTSSNREVWRDIQTLKEYEEQPGYEGWIWFRPKGVPALRGTKEHEKWFGFGASTIPSWDVGPLHYEDGIPAAEVLR